jgi:enoyl-CoA hydratase
MGEYETIRYEVEGAVATITLDRPDAANALSTQLIDELDAAFTRADRDDSVRVVVLAAAGRNFCAGHDLKELVADDGGNPWIALRETPEGKLRHEQVMYVERCLRIRDFRKPTIAVVQGTCIAAGLMLACMCDLIVASDDATFSNPVLRMTGAAVELLVEPWELGIRKAKEFLLCAETLSAAEACSLGMVNRVVPAADLAAEAHAMAERIALVPPVTAQVVKRSLNKTAELMGQKDSWDYHFMAHHWVHNTHTALSALEARKERGRTEGMQSVYAEHREPPKDA